MKRNIRQQVILIPDETGGYTVEVPSLPGCISEGDTLDEALANIIEALELALATVSPFDAIGFFTNAGFLNLD